MKNKVFNLLYAQIDLKDVTIILQDGGTDTEGAINRAQSSSETLNAGFSAAAGATSLTVDALIKAYYKGEKFTIDDDSTGTVYILAADANLGATTITIANEGGLAEAVDGAVDDGLVFLSGFPAGMEKIVVDDFASGDVVVGGTFTIAGDNQIYGVEAIDTAITTVITLSPDLQEAVADNVVITSNKTPNSVEVNIGEGNLTFSEKRVMEYVRNRGKLDTVREGDEEPIDVSLEIKWEFITSPSGAAAPTPVEALKRMGPASNWVSSSDDPCEPYSLDIVLKNIPGCGSDGSDETIILPDFRYEDLSYDMEAGTISVSGKCNVKHLVPLRNILA